jgi:2-aminomuconate deaminase
MASPDDATILNAHAQGLGSYPHARRAGDFIYVCGTSSRREDNTHIGAIVHDDGRVELDIREQTKAVVANMEKILKAAGSSLDDVVDLTTFLVSMDDFAGYNEVYNTFFHARTGPARTTVAVHQLPHPNLLIEIKAIAYAPKNRDL